MEKKPLNDVLHYARHSGSIAPRGLTGNVLARLEQSPVVRRTLYAAAIAAGVATILVSSYISRQIAVRVAADRPPVQQLFSPGGGLIDAS